MKGRKPEVRVARDALGEVPPPEWLGDYAQAYWVEVVRDLSARKILTNDNLPSVASYCIALGAVREAEEDIRELGRVVKTYSETKSGDVILTGVKPNPAVKQRGDAMSLALRLAAELGATPISRSRPSLPDDDGQDDLFDFEVDPTCYGQPGLMRQN
ncbi:phage terminase small subunit P27 family [Stagnihabitans tardus]|uniref:Phage terminase small subunit P27 family n=1 Tax=Stagnihabitans tardus TaxID=2699202 RepID=A0AAE4YAL8_9RHOB|nr:phage terminase small subunit P27 family [Stagnihabitans tardus]NBZ87911.1 phage terminase small subunit P27 family [Stagnihabitans tardus]